MEERQKRGFALLTPEQRSKVSSKGGISAHLQGRAHEFKRGSKLAREAGRKGGMRVRAKDLASMGVMPEES